MHNERVTVQDEKKEERKREKTRERLHEGYKVKIGGTKTRVGVCVYVCVRMCAMLVCVTRCVHQKMILKFTLGCCTLLRSFASLQFTNHQPRRYSCHLLCLLVQGPHHHHHLFVWDHLVIDNHHTTHHSLVYSAPLGSISK